MLQAGTEHHYLSLYASMGHGVWVPFLQNNVSGMQDAAALAEGDIPSVNDADVSAYTIAPTDEGSGRLDAEGYTNIFARLNAQSK